MDVPSGDSRAGRRYDARDDSIGAPAAPAPRAMEGRGEQHHREQGERDPLEHAERAGCKPLGVLQKIPVTEE